MKKYLIACLLFSIFVISCQKDDFCIDPTTPHLVIRFYDINNPDTYKNTSDLKVWAEGKDTIADYHGVATDSIAIQLNPGQDYTIYHLMADDIQDDITIEYTRKEVFVSRSCGYKYNFENLNISNTTNNWIQSIEITNETVEDETEHIKILH